MTLKTRYMHTVVLVATAVSSLGCSTTPLGGPASAQSNAASISAQMVRSDPPTGGACNTNKDSPGVADAIRTLPPYSQQSPQNRWKYILGNYNSCAQLSAVEAVPVEAGTLGPQWVLLFHDGKFVKTATDLPYGYSSLEAAVDTATVTIRFAWKKPGECEACASASARVSFKWVDNRVEQIGVIPPEARPVPVGK